MLREYGHILVNGTMSLQQAGLHPTAEQIELFAYHLPNASLSNLIVSTLHKL